MSHFTIPLRGEISEKNEGALICGAGGANPGSRWGKLSIEIIQP